MISFIRFLKEKYLDTLVYRKFGGESAVDVFLNPSKHEIGKIARENRYGELRWIADLEKENIYFWDANHLHDDVYNLLDGSGVHLSDIEKAYNGKVLTGILSMPGFKVKQSSLTHFTLGQLNKFKNSDVNLSWLERYMNYDDLMQGYERGGRI